MYSVTQDTEVNSRTFRVIRGRVNAAGAPTGKYEVIKTGMDVIAARELRSKLEYIEKESSELN